MSDAILRPRLLSQHPSETSTVGSNPPLTDSNYPKVTGEEAEVKPRQRAPKPTFNHHELAQEEC